MLRLLLCQDPGNPLSSSTFPTPERAILLASAIATSISGLRPSIRASPEPGRAPRREAHCMTDMAPMISSRRMSAGPFSTCGRAAAFRLSNVEPAPAPARRRSRDRARRSPLGARTLPPPWPWIDLRLQDRGVEFTPSLKDFAGLHHPVDLFDVVAFKHPEQIQAVTEDRTMSLSSAADFREQSSHISSCRFSYSSSKPGPREPKSSVAKASSHGIVLTCMRTS
jgi:hypothetical protein